MTAGAATLAGKRILVTGGSGFVGSRLVERIVLEEQAKARVLVHHPGRAARVARLPIEIVRGDVLNEAEVERAVEDCDIVFHCAYGTSPDEAQQRRVNVEGTRHVLEACRRARVKRVVHFSTLMVYGLTADGDLDESAPRRYFGNAYSDSKLDAETLAFDFMRRHQLPVVILQPTAVYGPFAVQWTVQVLEKMKAGRLIMVDGGEGLRNAVYIDDLVSAAVLAAVKEQAIGEAFLISGNAPVTWREFYRGFERMLGLSDRLVNLSAAEARALYLKTQKARGLLAEMHLLAAEHPEIQRRLFKTRELAFLARALRRLLSDRWRDRLKGRMAAAGNTGAPLAAGSPGDRLHLLDPPTIRFQASKTRVRIDKAERLLDYRPAFELSRGMALTERWARWAHLLAPTHPVLAAFEDQGSRFKVKGSETVESHFSS